MKYTTRKTILKKLKYEPKLFSINHIDGCTHGCKYPCYAFAMAKKFEKVKDYNEWLDIKIVENVMELLKIELPKLKAKNQIDKVFMSSTTDPFIYKNRDVEELSLKIINFVNSYDVEVRTLTKGLYNIEEISKLSKINKFGISLISLNEQFRAKYEPYTAPYLDRIESLKRVHENGFTTLAHIEPYPTPNIIKQDIREILDKIGFVNMIVFGKVHYNNFSSSYRDIVGFYKYTTNIVVDFCNKNGIKVLY